ncbi:GNAT family N-acetyltransferase [Streptomyces sp. NPDC008079]|uniref:GNAT family N-acetyltransferase n=1 Tax=unclassified Streptomyces TaxID=2593676 RepID=UPI0036E4AF4B
MKDDQLTLRLAQPDDSQQLAEIAQQAYGTYVEELDEPPAPLRLDYSRVASSGRTYVAEEAGKLQGMVTVERHDSHMVLRNLAVRPSCQGRGIGTKLVSFVEEFARDAGMDAVSLWTRVEMHDNIAFYQRRNYTVTHHEHSEQASRVFFLKKLR